MPRLKNRQMQLPNGAQFCEYCSTFKTTPWASFERMVDEVVAHRTANPRMVKDYSLNTDREAVADEIDGYLAMVAKRNGWTGFIVGGPDGPKSQALSQQGALKRIAAAASEVKKLVKGYKVIKEWRASENPAVPAEVSERRAAICADCPQNQKGEFTSWFTVPISEMIRKDIEDATGMGLETPYDDKLGVCKACDCPMRLKVHTPVEFIRKGTDDETLTKLKAVDKCWVWRELASSE